MKILRPIFSILLLGILLQCDRNTSLQLPAILGDHMVLQQNSSVNIWGWAEPAGEVKLICSWNGKSYSTRADTQGNWLIQVLTGPAGGPHSITIEGDITIVLEDILLGEVWICSGQSNMELPLFKTDSAKAEIAKSYHPEIRLFTVKKDAAQRPVEDVQGSWESCNPGSSKDFSAVGYYFGKKLHETLGVPVGLVNTAWESTPSESWTSREMLMKLGDYQLQFNELYSSRGKQLDKKEVEHASSEAEIGAQWDFENRDNIGYREGWMKRAYNDTDWKTMECPADWSTGEKIGIREGVVWLRKEISLPSHWLGKSLLLELGPVNEMDQAWVNGTEVGSSKILAHWIKNRKYLIPASAVHSEELMLSIRIVNTIAGGGMFGLPEQLRIYPEGNPQEKPVPLAGNWKYRIAYKFPGLSPVKNAHLPSVLYNGMIYPLKHFTIKGVIWYQGEANVGRAFQYRNYFPAMIQDWRNTWNQGSFPFYFVQLAPFNYSTEHSSAELREAQFLTLSKLRNTGMAVTLDVGNPDELHPSNKRDVGKRLALWALAKDYGLDLVYSGPLYRKQEVEGSSIRIHFKHVGSGLMAKGKELTHFEIAGKDQKYHKARALIDGETVVVSSSEVAEPVAVRYAWSNSALPNLFNAEGLPASSFCTDRWPRITDRY